MKETVYTCFFLITVFILTGSTLIAQDWELEKNTDGINIYTRSVADSELKELKVEFSIDLKLSPIVEHLNNAEIFNDWVNSSMVFESLQENGGGNGLYYGIVDFPWPLDDRDYVINTTTYQNPSTKVVTIESKNTEFSSRPNYPDYVRIPSHHNRWVLTPVSSQKTEISYWLKSDPGGAIPNWLINLVIDKGATRSIKNMLNMLANKTTDTHLSYIQEL